VSSPRGSRHNFSGVIINGAPGEVGDAGEDLVGSLGPDEGFGLGVMGVDADRGVPVRNLIGASVAVAPRWVQPSRVGGSIFANGDVKGCQGRRAQTQRWIATPLVAACWTRGPSEGSVAGCDDQATRWSR
jgi:hypothetical protein